MDQFSIHPLLKFSRLLAVCELSLPAAYTSSSKGKANRHLRTRENASDGAVGR